MPLTHTRGPFIDGLGISSGTSSLSKAYTVFTLELYSQAVSADQQGDRIHPLTVRVQRESWVGSWVGNFASVPLSPSEKWWPGTELNRRRQPFQGFFML